jgi:uracil DNA glycosylase
MGICLRDEIQLASESWRHVLENALSASSGLQEFLDNDYKKYSGELEVFPPPGRVFNAFSHFELSSLRVVILGQDVYPTHKLKF